MAARYGGEEFALILPDTDWNGAAHLAEHARYAVAQLQIPHAASAATHFVSVSGGIAVFDPRASTTPGQVIAAADQALFQAKSLGRNRIDSGGRRSEGSPSPAEAADLANIVERRRYLKMIKSVRLRVEALFFKGSFAAFELF